MDDKDLDKLLSDLGRDVPETSADLLGRVLGDAYELQPQPEPQAQVQVLPPEPPVPAFRQVLSVFGGWGGLSGLAFAASVGFVVGFNPPAALDAPFGTVWSSDASLFQTDGSDFGWDWEEG